MHLAKIKTSLQSLQESFAKLEETQHVAIKNDVEHRTSLASLQGKMLKQLHDARIAVQGMTRYTDSLRWEASQRHVVMTDVLTFASLSNVS